MSEVLRFILKRKILSRVGSSEKTSDEQSKIGYDSTQMADTLSRSERSERMALIRAANTKPEMVIRRLAHSLGYRYRLHRRDLPGVPDLVFPSRRAVIFVHGCFWHRHEGCDKARWPKSRLSYWIPKLEGNKIRDERNAKALRQSGWRVLVIWECELSDEKNLARRVTKFLGPTRPKADS